MLSCWLVYHVGYLLVCSRGWEGERVLLTFCGQNGGAGSLQLSFSILKRCIGMQCPCMSLPILCMQSCTTQEKLLYATVYLQVLAIEETRVLGLGVWRPCNTFWGFKLSSQYENNSCRTIPKLHTSDLCENLDSLMDSGAYLHFCREIGNILKKVWLPFFSVILNTFSFRGFTAATSVTSFCGQ